MTVTKHGINPVIYREEDYRGFNFKIWNLEEPNNHDALVEIYRDGALYREFLIGAYKMWNIPAHFTDIIDGEIQENFSGYDLALSTGLEFLRK